ncbi:MAG: M28 family peptidase [Cytophagales bacterium]|nr:M28 family peptidase [Cytophagales bacterium]
MKQFLSMLILIFIFSCVQTVIYEPISSIKVDISILASDSLMGREVGTEGEKMAADYIVSRMEAIGLEGKGTDGFLQDYFVKTSDNPHEKAEVGADGDTVGITGYNVLGYLDNPSDQIVVIGAHFDHLGMGGLYSTARVDEIHNGADDNASGTAAILHLAQVIKKLNLQTDFLFFAISGEEQGLWGSNYFTKNPTIDLSKVTYMINMDMVGRLDEERGLAVYGTGTARNWEGLLDEINTDSLKMIRKPSGRGPSDHTSFYLKDIPVLHFFTGQHEDYHKPSDDIEKINLEGIKTVADMIERIVVALDESEKLEFKKTKDEESNTPRFTVTLGVMPDYLFEGEGMLIADVSADKPAMKAGILRGDIVVQMGDSTVADMMGYMRALSSFSAGDQTTVVVERDGEKVEVMVEF